jgi:hypothetical protein
MAVVLAYTSPAIGHPFPFCALLGELAARGHQIHVRTLASGVGVCRRLGFAAERVDPPASSPRYAPSWPPRTRRSSASEQLQPNRNRRSRCSTDNLTQAPDGEAGLRTTFKRVIP